MKRRHFLTTTLAGAAALGSGLLVSAQTSSPSANATPAPAGNEPKRPPAIDLALVREFVGAGHRNLPRVKELLAENPRLIVASYDWGSGDFETALGGAAHVGNREMALHLLSAGARIDAFAAAMMGETDVLLPLLRFSPPTANARGPHGYSLLYHAGYSGKVSLAEAMGPHLKERAHDFNQALQTASLAGHAEFVAWLLKNGVDNPNTKNFAGKTPLDVALDEKHEAIAKLLRDAGGVSAR